MEVDVARSILQEATRGGYLDDPLPEKDDEIVELGQYYARTAQEAWDADIRDDAIEAIIRLATGEMPAKTTDPTPDEVPAAESAREPVYSSGTPPRSSGGYSESDLREPESASLADKAIENLPLPPEVEGEARPMPRDLTTLDDKEVRGLSGEYNAFLARAKWLLAVANSDLANAKHLRDAAFGTSLKKIGKVDPITEKAKLKEVLFEEAKEDSEYKWWDEAVHKDKERTIKLEALVDIYSGHIDRLSREWTMRQNEFEKAHR